MSSKKNTVGLEAILDLLDEYISPSDVISAKCLGNISAEIVKERLNLKMTQSEFANYLGVSQGMVSKWEGSDYNFSIKALADIAAKLDLNLEVHFSKISTDKISSLSEINQFTCKSSKENTNHNWIISYSVQNKYSEVFNS